MTATTERAVAAMRAIGGTVTGAPPLRLPARAAAAESSRPPQPAASRRPARSLRLGRPARLSDAVPAGHAWRLWLVPATAALAVVALAVSLALVRSAPEDSALLPGPANLGTPGAAGPDGVPPYYVTLPASFGWYAYAPASPQASPQGAGLIVGETATATRLATVPPPHGMTFNVVTGAADDRTFVVGATSYVPGEKTVGTYWTETWYLLRISPGTAHVATVTRLPISPVPYVTGVALSPDGTELAVADRQYPGGSSGAPRAGLTVWSAGTGKALRRWHVATGYIAAAAHAAGTVSRPGPFDTGAMATALHWTPDGGELAFAWDGTEIRLLDLTGPASRQGDLVNASRFRAGIGTGYTPAGSSFTCDAASGWSLSTSARTFTCAGSITPAHPATGKNCGKAAPAYPAIIQQTELAGGAQEMTTLATSASCAPASVRLDVASLGWAGADGSRVIATLASTVLPGDARFGVYTRKTFTALPALLAIGSLATVAW
jgi:hypothetical protein